jgi:hypothetical protein
LKTGLSVFNTGRQQTKLLFKSCATLNSVTQFLDGHTSSLHQGITSTKFQRLVTSSGSGRNWKEVPKKYSFTMRTQWTDRDLKRNTFWMVSPLCFTCYISSVIFTDMMQTVLETCVFHPNILILCISYILGMSTRKLKLGMLFIQKWIQKWKCCPLYLKKLLGTNFVLNISIYTLIPFVDHILGRSSHNGSN